MSAKEAKDYGLIDGVIMNPLKALQPLTAIADGNSEPAVSGAWPSHPLWLLQLMTLLYVVELNENHRIHYSLFENYLKCWIMMSWWHVYHINWRDIAVSFSWIKVYEMDRIVVDIALCSFCFCVVPSGCLMIIMNQLISSCSSLLWLSSHFQFQHFNPFGCSR